jgi:hypothetical protein
MSTTEFPNATEPQAVGIQLDISARPAAVAWKYLQATFHDGDIRGRGWLPALKFTEPKWEPMQKDVQPLYDQATIDAAVALAVAAERERWKAAMPLPHLYGGDCPDRDQPHARDPNCQACRALVALGA